MKNIKRILFGFIWVSGKTNDDKEQIEIKGQHLKITLKKEDHNKPLKLIQFIRANRSKHPIKIIPGYCMEKKGCSTIIQQKYEKITEKEEVTGTVESTIDNLCDFTRKLIIGNRDSYTGDINAMNFTALTKIITCLLKEINKNEIRFLPEKDNSKNGDTT